MKNHKAVMRAKTIRNIITIISVICILLISLSSCSSFSAEDQKKAEDLALQSAESFFNKNCKGKIEDGMELISCTTSIKNSEFKNGNYIVTVDVKATASYDGYYLTLHFMDIEYTIKVKNGNATVLHYK